MTFTPGHHPDDPRRDTRDETLVHAGRMLREQRRLERQRRQRMQLTVAVTAIGTVALVVAGWWVGRAGPQRPAVAVELSAARSADAQSSADGLRERLSAAGQAPAPTPILATYGDVTIRLPVALDDLTEVGFHQAARDYGLHLKTSLPTADTDAAKKAHGTGRDKSKQATGEDAVLVGSVLRMWRNRPGPPDSAVDCGAPPGSTVLSPVDGEVVLVKPYKLYGRVDDFEIHIRPTGHPEIDLVMIHVTDIAVTAGDQLDAGVTPIARVRRISDKMHTQLADYVTEGGNHVHFQLNDATDPDYKGLRGAAKDSTGGS